MSTQARPLYEDTPPGFNPDFDAPAYKRIPQMAIVLAVQDACGPEGSCREKARAWIFDEGSNFRTMAELADWDVDYLRRKLLALIEGGGRTPRSHRKTHSRKRDSEGSGEAEGDLDGAKYEDDERAGNATPAHVSLARSKIALQ